MISFLGSLWSNSLMPPSPNAAAMTGYIGWWDGDNAKDVTNDSEAVGMSVKRASLLQSQTRIHLGATIVDNYDKKNRH